jgi:hypothetical protein
MVVLSDPIGNYKLTLGTLIRAKVTATNSMGESIASAANSIGVSVQTIAQTPSTGPIRVEDQSTTSSITVKMTEVIDFSPSAGGAEITSYNLEYNNGAGTTFVEVVGLTIEQLETEVTVSTTPGSTYIFRYRVKNIFGFSGYSP